MADWSRNNRACTTLWTTLFNMQQLSTNFDDSGDLTMKDLVFFNPLSSSGLRKQEATIIADQLDHIFRVGRGAKYEDSVDRASAMSRMVDTLVDEDKQVKDLASVIDDSYNFWGETK
jgi:hypothetical protein